MTPVQKNLNDVPNVVKIVDLMKTLGVDGEDVRTLEAGIERVKQHLEENRADCKWEAGKGFRVFAEQRTQDEQMRSALQATYTDASRLLNDFGFGDEINPAFSHQKITELKRQLGVKPYVILVAGETSAGKSSLLNLILGEDLLPVAHMRSTSLMCELKYGDECAMTVYFKDKSKPEVEYPFIEKGVESIKQEIKKIVVTEGEVRENSEYEKIELRWPHPLLKEGVCIVDSPGFGESEVFDEMLVEYLENAFAFIYIIDSSNAGGLKNREGIIKLLEEVRTSLETKQTGFSSKSTLFVFNKWDTAPKREIEDVKKKTTERLLKALPDLDPETQVLCFSTSRAALAQEYGITSREFADLLDAIESLVSRGMRSRIEGHVRWLNSLIDWRAITAKIVLNDANRDHEETVAHIQRVHAKLNRLQSSQEEAMRELERHLKAESSLVAVALEEHFRSDVFREKFCCWKHEEEPAADPDSWLRTEETIQKRVYARFSGLVEEWEKENHVVADAIKDFTNGVLSKYQEFEQELAQLEQQPRLEVFRSNNAHTTVFSSYDDKIPTIALAIPGIIFLPLNLAATLIGAPAAAAIVALEDHEKVLLATSPLWGPFALVSGILALPAVGAAFGIDAFVTKVRKDTEKRKIKSYDENRTAELRRVSSGYLDNILCHTVIDQYAKHLLAPAEECLQHVKEGIPGMIRSYQELYDKLEVDKRSKEELKETYGRLREDCRTVKTKLAGLFPELFARPPMQVSAENTSDRNLAPSHK